MDLSERGAGSARHPWELERLRAYADVLREHGALGAERVLDVGAGDGWFSESLLAELPAAEEVVCWDINYNDLQLTSEDPRISRTRIAPTPGFDLVLLLDVIEHIEHPRPFIAESLRPLTSPGTPVLVSVPAHPLLFSDHDRALHHFRRYRPRQLLEEVSGWIEVLDHGPLFTSLVAPRAASVAVERARRRGRPAAEVPEGEHGVGGWNGGPLVTRCLSAALRADAVTVRALGRRTRLGRNLPGLSHWVYGVTR